MSHILEAIPLPESPAYWCQAFFAITSCATLSLAIAPAAERKLLLNYGPRSVDSSKGNTKGDKTAVIQENSLLKAVRSITSWGHVPHSWFFMFYLSYILCAAFWAAQYFQHSHNLLRSFAQKQAEFDSSSMTWNQVVMVWCLMVLQATRRLYECWLVMKPSKSTMWFVHWVLGMAYYMGVSVAIWVEGSNAILQSQQLLAEWESPAHVKIKTAVAFPLFFFGWVMQYRCHKHLAGLEKYSLPHAGMFRYLVCPHYTCECLIYFSLAIVAAPEGQWFSRTLLSVLMFVAVNLGVTASGTRKWYVDKFGPGKIMGKSNMIPWVY